MHPSTAPSTGSAVDIARRMTSCSKCIQPLEHVGAAEETTLTCSQCGATTRLAPRENFLRSHDVDLGAQPPRFRAQDGVLQGPPPGIAFLWDASHDLSPHSLSEAKIAWQGARTRSASNDVGAGEELVWLTRGLVLDLERKGNPLAARSLLEAALEVLPLPRQRAMLLGVMARLAVRLGDLTSARAWIAFFEPPADLTSDSELRLSLAALATAEGRFPEVLRLLGRTSKDVAIADALDPQALLFRANALERSGEIVIAMKQLHDVIAPAPQMRDLLITIAHLFKSLDLCPTSLSETAKFIEKQKSTNAGSGQRTVGLVLLVLTFFLFFGAGAIFIGVYRSRGMSFDMMPGFILAFVGLITGSLGLRFWRQGKREAVIFDKGVSASARVLRSEGTGIRVNRMPEMKIFLEVMLNPPVQSSLKLVVSPASQHILIPGTVLHVRIIPSEPDMAVLE